MDVQYVQLPVVIVLIPVLRDIQDLNCLVSHNKFIFAECFEEVPHPAQNPGCLTDGFSTAGCRTD